MKISKWIEIEEALTKKVGWNRTITIMTDAHRNLYPNLEIYQLDEFQEKQLIKRIKKIYENDYEREAT